MPTCKNCGESIEEGKKFCSNCGAPVPTAKKCPNCGTECKPGVKFCPECGTKLQAEPVPVPGGAPGSVRDMPKEAPPPTGQTLSESAAKENDWETAYEKECEAIWLKNESVLKFYNVVKFLGLLAASIATIFVVLNMQSTFEKILCVVAIYLGMGIGVFALKEAIRPAEIEETEQKYKQMGHSPAAATPPGLRNGKFIAAFVLSAVIAVAGVRLLAHPPEEPPVNSGANAGTGINSTDLRGAEPLDDVTISEACQAFADEISSTYGITITQPSDLSIGSAQNGADILEINRPISVSTLMGDTTVDLQGQVEILSPGPSGDYRVSVSEATDTSISSLIFSEEDLCYSASAFDIYYTQTLSTDIQKSDFKERMKGKTMYWGGTVTQVSASGLFGDNLIILDTDSGGELNVYFQDTEYDRLLQINEGDRITFTGTFTGQHLLGEYVIREAVLR